MAKQKSIFPGDPSLLSAALQGLELQKARIEEQIRSVKAIMGGPVAKAPAAPKAKAVRKRKKRDLSPEARARIAAAQKKRWANYRKVQKQAASE